MTAGVSIDSGASDLEMEPNVAVSRLSVSLRGCSGGRDRPYSVSVFDQVSDSAIK